VALVFPIGLLLLAVLFDIAVLMWAANRTWHDRLWPGILRVEKRAAFSLRLLARLYGQRILHH